MHSMPITVTLVVHTSSMQVHKPVQSCEVQQHRKHSTTLQASVAKGTAVLVKATAEPIYKSVVVKAH